MLKKKDKAAWKSAEDVEKKALAILEILDSNAGKKLTGAELRMLLLFYGMEKKKHGKNVADMRAKYNELKEKNTAPLQYKKKWTDVDKAELTKAMGNNIGIDDTELGRQRAQLEKQKKEELAAFAKDNPEVAAQILASMLSSLSASSDEGNHWNQNWNNPNNWVEENNQQVEANNQNNLNLNSSESDDETVIPTQPWL